jgi:lipoprotein-releasing system ATP-binding protein
MSELPSRDVLRCENLGKTYAEGDLQTEVFKELNFSIAEGEMVAVIGSSGAGKSTLLHLMGGLDLPTSGEVYVQQNAMSILSDRARGQLRNRTLGFIYQFHHLLPEFTALENVCMPLLIGQMPLTQAEQKAKVLLERVGLSSRLRHKSSELSGGERQRVAVARALVTRPACILADEPTGNLDERNALSIYELMLEMNREAGTSLVLATHDRKLAARMDRVLEISGGVLKASS